MNKMIESLLVGDDTSKTCTFHPPSLNAWKIAIVAYEGAALLLGIPIGIALYNIHLQQQKQQQQHESEVEKEDGGGRSKYRRNVFLCLGYLGAVAAHRGVIAPCTTTLQEGFLLLGLPLGILLYSYLQHQSERNVLHRRYMSIFLGCEGAMLIHRGMPYLLHQQNELVVKLFPQSINWYLEEWIILFLTSSVGFSFFFKCLAFAYNFQPIGATKNLNTFLLWFVLLPEPIFIIKGGEFLKYSTKQEMMTRLKCFVTKIVGMFVLLTYLLNTKTNTSWDGSPSSSFFQNLMTSYTYLWFLYFWASFCFDFNTLPSYLSTKHNKGIGNRPLSFYDGFRNPLLESRTLQSLWGSKWNVPVHVLLKHGVYLPCRHVYGINKTISLLATFVASGILHEYVFSLHNSQYYVAGNAMLFFLTMGVAMLFEDWFWKLEYPAVQKLATLLSYVPTPIISIVVSLIICIPFEPLFVRSWILSGFIPAISKLMPHIQCS